MDSFWKVVKWGLGIGLVVLIVCGGGGVFIGPKAVEFYQKQRNSEKGTLVQVEAAKRGELTRTVSAPGTVVARTEVNITSRVSAMILALPFEEGDEVKRGDNIVELDSKELRAALAASEARLRADQAGLAAAEAQLVSERARIDGTRASLTKAVADYERQQSLFTSGDVSQSELDSARAEMDRQQSAYEAQLAGLLSVEANVDAARARVNVAEADVERATESVEYCIIRSPIDGVITRRMMREGEVALGTISNIGSAILTIADLSEMLVLARIAEVDVARVKHGQRALVQVNGYPDEVFEGTLRKLALQSLVGSDGTIAFDAEFLLRLEGRRIFTGLTANVDVEVETLEDAVVVPSQAVLDKRTDDLPRDLRENNDLVDPNRTFIRVVYTVKDGKAQMRPVRVVASNLVSSAISAGLEPGEEVVVGPYRSLQSLRHDALVRFEGTGAETNDASGAEESETATAVAR